MASAIHQIQTEFEANTVCDIVLSYHAYWLQVGVMHTNYRELGRRNAGLVVSGVSTLMNYLVCAIHCHKVCTLVCPSRMMCCTCAWSNQAVASLQRYTEPSTAHAKPLIMTAVTTVATQQSSTCKFICHIRLPGLPALRTPRHVLTSMPGW